MSIANLIPEPRQGEHPWFDGLGPADEWMPGLSRFTDRGRA